MEMELEEPKQLRLLEAGEVNLTISLEDKDTKNSSKVSVNILHIDKEIVRRNATVALLDALKQMGL